MHPIPDAIIKVKGTNIGTQADKNGHFMINVPTSDSTLVVSFYWFCRREITITTNQRQYYKVALDEASLRWARWFITRSPLPKRIWHKIKRIF